MVVTDAYPSRVSPTPEIAERNDPVVHGDIDQLAATGPLAREQLAFYSQNGYVLRKGVFSAQEVERIRREMDEFLSAAGGSDGPEVVRESGSREVRSVFAVHRPGSPFAALAGAERLAGAARQLLGGPVYVHQSRINLKRGFSGKDFYWHSDFETWHVEDGMPRMRAVSFSVLVDDNHVFNGPLMVFPGSHRHYIRCVGRTPDEHYKQSLRRQEYGIPDQQSLRWLYDRCGIDVPTAPAGSVLMFECNLMHGSNGNISPLPRRNVFIVYNSLDNVVQAPFGGTEPRPEFVATRMPEPLQG